MNDNCYCGCHSTTTGANPQGCWNCQGNHNIWTTPTWHPLDFGTTTGAQVTTNITYDYQQANYQLLKECVSLLKEIITILKPKKKKGRKK